MKSTVIALIVTSLSTSFVSAQDGSPTDTDMDKQLSKMQEDMNSMLQQIATLRQQSQLQENIHMMQSQIDNLQRTTDPKERQKLIQEHLETLQEHMKMIESMGASEVGSGSKKKAAPAPARGKNDLRPRPDGLPGRHDVWSRHDDRSAGLSRRHGRAGQFDVPSSRRPGNTEV